MRLLPTLTTAIALAAQTPLVAAIAISPDPDPGNPQQKTLSESLLSRLSHATTNLLPRGIWSPRNTTPNPDPDTKPNNPPGPFPLRAPVDWDKNSLLILGMREMLFSGEFHPFRLPVPSLWWDVLEKIKAAGLNTVSFHVHWALLEGTPGVFSVQGVFDLGEFFRAAKEVGVWLVARPGPYINAEVSGGGLPGWIQRLKGHPRTADVDYLAATNTYASNIAAIIAKAQVSEGGKVLLYQPESGYSLGRKLIGFNFPDPGYMQYVESQARSAGVTVPFINNDGTWSTGNNVPGSGQGQVDIYGNSLYPLDSSCADLAWQMGSLRTSEYSNHMNISPSTPVALTEFQAGSLDFWGYDGFSRCAERTNHEFSRVFYKNNIGSGVTIQNLYMIFGGTNWGNLGYDSGYTSYDFGAAIAEDRTITREKYSELKLQAQFLKVSPGYLNATPPLMPSMGVYSPARDIAITAVTGNQGSFYVVRHADFRSRDSTNYTLTLPTSGGDMVIPHLGGALTLGGRDSKIHVTDYPVGAVSLMYCTAEVFTWQKFENRTVVVLYGAMGESHEILVNRTSNEFYLPDAIASKEVNWKTEAHLLYAQWTTGRYRQFVRIGSLYIYMVDRNSAYDYWVTELPNYGSLIINGGYLVRSASLDAGVLSLRADFNRTTTIELIGVPSAATSLAVNGAPVSHLVGGDGHWIALVDYQPPNINLPDLTTLDWKYLDSMPELQPSYDDSAWLNADRTTNNTYLQSPLTPTSLYASDYGFHTGALLFRGHFTAVGTETAFNVITQGGQSFASTVWLNGNYIGSWAGKTNWDVNTSMMHRDTYPVAGLKAGAPYVLTVLIDNMGFAQNALVGADLMKAPRGIMEYKWSASAGDGPSITWKVTGNLGGENYADKVRGPLNEGGLYAERQGYHQPNPPADQFTAGSPFTGIDKAGVGFYTVQFDLDLPADKWDIPLRFEFPKIDTTGSGNYRALLYVNGFQFGRYISHIGPQTSFPVPEGILNHDGPNTLAIMLWAPQPSGARIVPLTLQANTPVLTGRRAVKMVAAPGWVARAGAY